MIIGLVTSGISVAIFGGLHLPYFYFLGVISGFISLIPYLGVFLAVLPPWRAASGYSEPDRNRDRHPLHGGASRGQHERTLPKIVGSAFA